MKHTHLTAPLSGIVTNIKTLQGQTVIASQEAPTIMTLADLDTMLVKPPKQDHKRFLIINDQFDDLDEW